MALRPTYWEWRAELEASRARWRLGTVSLGACSMVLVVLLVWTATRPAPVYFFAAGPGGSVGGLVRADRIPSEVVEQFAAEAAMAAGNLMPETARRSYERFRSSLAPALQRRMATQAAADLAAIEQKRLSTSFTVRQSRAVTSAAGQWIVEVVGLRRSWNGAQLMSEEDIAYRFEVTKGRPSARNYSGLEITQMEVGRAPASGSEPSPLQAAERVNS